MKPPPPRLPASGWTTARANPTATAASTALPPCRRMSRPTWLAMGLPDTTMALGALVDPRSPGELPSRRDPGSGDAGARRRAQLGSSRQERRAGDRNDAHATPGARSTSELHGASYGL